MIERRTQTRRIPIFLGERQTSVFQRVIAKAIDMIIVVAIYLLGGEIWGPVGIVAAVLMCALQDGLGEGQSVGKKIIGLRVIEEQTGMGCSFTHSAIRNLPFVLAILFTSSPFLWILLLLIPLPGLLLETYLIFSLDSGVRVGDVLGNTLVIEYIDESWVPS